MNYEEYIKNIKNEYLCNNTIFMSNSQSSFITSDFSKNIYDYSQSPEFKEQEAIWYAEWADKVLNEYHSSLGYKIRSFFKNLGFPLKEWQFNNYKGWY